MKNNRVAIRIHSGIIILVDEVWCLMIMCHQPPTCTPACCPILSKPHVTEVFCPPYFQFPPKSQHPCLDISTTFSASSYECLWVNFQCCNPSVKLQLTLLVGSDVSRGGWTADLCPGQQDVLSTIFPSEIRQITKGSGIPLICAFAKDTASWAAGP